MTQKYYLSKSVKFQLMLLIVVILLSTGLLLIIKESFAIDLPGLIPLAVIDAIGVSIIIWRIRTPMIEISDTWIKVGVPFFFRCETARWSEIEGMVINEISTFGSKHKVIKLLLKSEEGTTKEVMFNTKAIERSEEVITKLRERIPEKRYEDVIQSLHFQPPGQKEIKYRGWITTVRLK